MSAQNDAQSAVFELVQKVCEEALEYSGTTQSQMLRDAGLAYRLAAGGPQPGGVPVKD